MPIDFRCSKCQNPMQRPDHMAGKKATCPKCSTINAVPGGGAPAAVASSTTPPAAAPPAVAAPPAATIPPTVAPAAEKKHVASDVANQKVAAPTAAAPPPPKPAPPKPAPPIAPKPVAPLAPPKPAVAPPPKPAAPIAPKPAAPIAPKPVVPPAPPVVESPPPVIETSAPPAAHDVADKVSAAPIVTPPPPKPAPPKAPKPVAPPAPPMVEVPAPVIEAPPQPVAKVPPPPAAEKHIAIDVAQEQTKPPAAAPLPTETTSDEVQISPAPAKPAPPTSNLAPAKKAAPTKKAAPVAVTNEPEYENRDLAGPRWESRGMGPGTYFATILQVCLTPVRTFRNLSGEAGMMPATWFLLLGLVAVGIGHGLALFFLPTAVLEGLGLKEISIYFKVGAHDAVGAILLTGLFSIIATLFVMGLLFLEATFINSILKTLGAEADSVEHTYRVLALVLGATAWLSFVPVIGPLLMLLAQPPLQTLSVGPANGVSMLRSLIAVGIAWGTFALAALIFWVSLLVLNSAPAAT